MIAQTSTHCFAWKGSLSLCVIYELCQSSVCMIERLIEAIECHWLIDLLSETSNMSVSMWTKASIDSSWPRKRRERKYTTSFIIFLQSCQHAKLSMRRLGFSCVGPQETGWELSESKYNKPPTTSSQGFLTFLVYFWFLWPNLGPIQGLS